MSDERALLAAIRDNPDEDTPRLVYADWLDEHATTESQRARAEFIRLQCEEAQIDHEYLSDNGFALKTERRLRIQQLRKTFQQQWEAEAIGKTGWLPGRGEGFWFERGFPETLWASAETLLAYGDHIFRLSPIAQIIATATRGSLGPLIAAPWFRRVRSLELDAWQEATPIDWQVLADYPPLANLEQLSFNGGQLTRDGGARLAAANPFPRLRKLNLNVHSDGSWPDDNFSGSEGLLSGPRFGQLEAVRLDPDMSIELGTDLAALIANSPCLDRVTDFGIGSDGISAEAARILATGRFWPKLRKLCFSFLRDSAARAIATAGLPPLKHLRLGHNRFSPAGIEVLANCPQLGTVEILDLDSSSFGDEGVRALVRSPYLGNLRRLTLSGWQNSPFGPLGAKALAACPLLARLESLELRFSKIGSEGAIALADSPYLGGLKELIVDKVYGKARKRLRKRFGARVAFL